MTIFAPMKTKKTRKAGGGRKPQYKEKTDTFATRAPISHIPRLKGIMKKELNKLKK